MLVFKKLLVKITEPSPFFYEDTNSKMLRACSRSLIPFMKYVEPMRELVEGVGMLFTGVSK